jgi:hypothetical protein
MHGKRLSLRLLIVPAALAAAGCAGVVFIETALDVAAQAQSSSNFSWSSQVLSPSGELFQYWFRSPNRKGRHRPSGSSRVSKQHETKSRPEHDTKTSEQPATPGIGPASVPLPQPRPVGWPEPHSFAEAAGPDFNSTDVSSVPSDCDQSLSTIADIELLPRLIGPGDCGGRDMVELNFVVLPDRRAIEIRPTATLRCVMAESFATWVRDDVVARIDTLDTALRGVETYGSYECRGRNGVQPAKLSEHARGNAIDVRGLVLAGGRRIELTDVSVSKSLREDLRNSACHRFTTVLGPGADGYHNGHIHFDILDRRHGYRICQWDVREPPRTRIAMATTSLRTQGQSRANRTATVGRWEIATIYKANRFESCAMSRSEGDLGIAFVRSQDGLLLILDSPKWKLDRGKAYSVRLSAGSQPVDAKALAETRSVTIALADSRLNSMLRSANVLEVRGKGDTLRVPLDGSAQAFEQLDDCFNKSNTSISNPFVRHKASETNPFVAPNRKR